MSKSRASRLAAKRTLIESSDEEDNVPLKRLTVAQAAAECKTSLNKTENPEKEKNKGQDDSSSESDLDDYLQPADKIDLNSSFFKTFRTSDFEKIEKKMFASTSRLSESDSSNENGESQNLKPQVGDENDITLEQSTSSSNTKMDFKEMSEYTKKIDEARKFVEQYTARKAVEEKILDISNLLAVGEQKTSLKQTLSSEDWHSSDFESCDSGDDWEEIHLKEIKESQRNIVPAEGLQITVSMPETIKKKKRVDLLAAMKRRLNRIRKENQVLVHKVHVLCWIAHGNYVNSVINSPQILAMGLSLLPSDKCYPPSRTDLGYLEQILNWYKKTVALVERPQKKGVTLEKSLEQQISKRETNNKKCLVYIFIAILRSLGIKCRLVLSLQVEPIRPAATDLHSLSAKESEKAKHIEKGAKSKNTKVKEGIKTTDGISDKKNKGSKSPLEGSEAKEKALKNVEKSTKVQAKQPATIKQEKSKSQDKKDSSKSKNTKSERPKLEVLKSETKTRNVNQDQIDINNKKGLQNVKNDNSNLLAPKPNTRSKSVEKRVPKESTSSKTRSKSASDTAKKKDASKSKTSKADKESKRIPQVDGPNDSSDDDFVSSPTKVPSKSPKPNLRKLKDPQKKLPCPQKEKCAVREKNKTSSAAKGVNLKKLMKPESSPKISSKTSNHFSPKKQLDVRNDIINIMKGRIAEQKHIDRSRKVHNKRRVDYTDDDSDSDYAPAPIKKKHRNSSEDDFQSKKTKVKHRIRVKKTESGKLKVISSDEETSKKKKAGNDVWAEVFLESEGKWISVDVVQGQVHCIKELYNRASHPISYILAWDNANYLKDVTKRYCLNFSTVTRKLRADPKWWEETVRPFMGPPTAIDKEEDDDLARQQLDQPMPKSIAEYKNHPLYALKRHLLKFEAIYPPDAPTVGFIRGEAVYPRDCVYTLHSRDIWLKQAKVVKPGEKPYKIVKARPKYDKLSNKVITDQLLEIFGPWQTEDYVPPTAENGVVPRNAFGNVELFKACMLPKGTVHLKLPGLNKIAKRMNIDCASAIVGFDFHGGWSHPTYDGFVVCEEYEDQLIAAWELEQEEIEKREQEKIDKRVYGNWKRLIRGLLIRERLKARYDFGEPSGEKDKKKAKGPKLCTKKR